MQLFDAPSREYCVVRRERTNTPAGALVVLNDIQFVEAARCFAERTLREGGETDTQRLTYAFRVATARTPTERELGILTDLLAKMRERFSEESEAATELASSGEYPRDENLSDEEVAAWTIITSTLLNLDETITKG